MKKAVNFPGLYKSNVSYFINPFIKSINTSAAIFLLLGLCAAC